MGINVVGSIIAPCVRNQGGDRAWPYERGVFSLAEAVQAAAGFCEVRPASRRAEFTWRRSVRLRMIWFHATGKASNLIRTNRFFKRVLGGFRLDIRRDLPFLQRVQLALIGRRKKAFIAGKPNNAPYFLQLFFANCPLCLNLWGSLLVSAMVAFR